ncbi:hypothetical protein J8273_6491 [Carpediemonas membranifera]|uniref:Uncharacterized protein n=1 Tax=Carpediemonas membranifera TaxID=201153 RepID=A0A8J6AT44_9EUKA|nr:hypothetical protein J8273_6491 [Carpediemonas membranifera]|eukprot:KAG9391715.1 hypothetical protein J8273_6491 [Carpediemonas membranifera]
MPSTRVRPGPRATSPFSASTLNVGGRDLVNQEHALHSSNLKSVRSSIDKSAPWGVSQRRSRPTTAIRSGSRAGSRAGSRVGSRPKSARSVVSVDNGEWPHPELEEPDLSARIGAMDIERPADLSSEEVEAYSRFVEILSNKSSEDALNIMAAAFHESKEVALMMRYDGCH